MAGDKDIQTQDQTYQVQGYCAVVDDNMDYRRCVRRDKESIDWKYMKKT